MSSRKHIEWYSQSVKSFGDIVCPREGDTEGPAFRGMKGQQFLHLVCKRFIDGVAAIQADKNFTPEGKAVKNEELANACLAEIAQKKAMFLDPLIVNYKSAAGKLYGLMKVSDSVALFRRMELRTFFRSVDGETRLAAFDHAVDIADSEVVAAFIEQSDIYQLLGKEILNAGLKKFLAKKDPALAQEHSESERSGSILTENFRHVIEDLGIFASSDKSPDIQAMLDGLPQENWSHVKSGDSRMIDSATMPSMLPNLIPKPMRREAMKQPETKVTS